jgi:hypothetical protein
MSKPSKFDHMMTTARSRAAEPVAPPPEPAAEPITPPALRPPGRPRNGKRSKPGARQVTAYVDGDLYLDVVDILTTRRNEARRAGRKALDFSDLVGNLLAEWLKSQ